MENKFFPTVGKCYFMLIAVMMYYFLNEALDLGLYITYRHAFALVLLISAFFAFLCKPNVARVAASVKGTLVYCFPWIVTTLISLYIWFVGQVDTAVISRGLSSYFVYTNVFSFTFVAIAFLYIFGEKGIWYNLIAILTSNILTIITIIIEHGFGAFFSELTTLILTFAGETGEIIVQAEVHELAFCLGAYMIYMLLKPKKNIPFFILLGLSVFCFIAAFKRIAFLAIAMALIVGWLLKLIAKIKKKTAMNIAVFITVMVIILMILYVVLIKLDIFTMLEKAGIETSGRDMVYTAVDKFYEISPEFLGNGVGFLTYELNTNMSIGVAYVHNGFLQNYIDLGFWGYILWLVSITLVRVCYFGRKGDAENGIITLALTLYLVIVSSTDNTLDYPLLITVLAIIMIGNGYGEKVRAAETKLFGTISDVNKEAKGAAIL